MLASAPSEPSEPLGAGVVLEVTPRGRGLRNRIGSPSMKGRPRSAARPAVARETSVGAHPYPAVHHGGRGNARSHRFRGREVAALVLGRTALGLAGDRRSWGNL